MRKIAVIASASGNGKTTLGRELARKLDVPFVEVDALVHGPGWAETPDDELRAQVEPIVASDGWVIDGVYRGKLGRPRARRRRSRRVARPAASRLGAAPRPSHTAPHPGPRAALERQPRVAPVCVLGPRVALRVRPALALPPPAAVPEGARAVPGAPPADAGAGRAVPINHLGFRCGDRALGRRRVAPPRQRRDGRRVAEARPRRGHRRRRREPRPRRAGDAADPAPLARRLGGDLLRARRLGPRLAGRRRARGAAP